jgi:hypothetical protein
MHRATQTDSHFSKKPMPPGVMSSGRETSLFICQLSEIYENSGWVENLYKHPDKIPPSAQGSAAICLRKLPRAGEKLCRDSFGL